MGYIQAVYAIWLREAKVFFREKERVISSLFTPLIWIMVFGAGLGASVEIYKINYQQFIYPGIVAMSVLFGSIFYGLYIIWDRKLDFLKEVLVAPIPRSAAFFGKALGGATDVLIQVIALIALGILLGLVPSLESAVLVLFASMIISLCMVSLGLIIGANMKSPEGFNLVMSFMVWPMFMLSGALFPIDKIPPYFQLFVIINPLTYGVDLLRYIIIGNSFFGILYDIVFIIIYALVFAAIGILSFEKIKV